MYTGPEKQMEAMTIQMEQGILQEDYSLESKTGTEEGYSSSSELKKATTENVDSNMGTLSVNDVKYIFAGTDAMPTPSIQEDMSGESPFDDTLVAGDSMSSSPGFCESDIVIDPIDTLSFNYSDASLAVGSSESSQLEENGDALKLVNSSTHDADTTNLNSDDQGGLLGSKGTENSNFSLESSSSSFPRTVDEDHYVHSDKMLNEWKSIPNKSFVDANGTQHPVSEKEYLDLDELQKDIPNESYVKLRDLNASGIQDPVSDKEHLDLEELQDIPNKSYEKLHDLDADREYLDMEELEKDIPNKSYVKLCDLNASGIQHSAPDGEYLDLDELQKDITNKSYVKLRDLNADREYLDLEELEKDITNKSHVKLHDLNASGSTSSTSALPYPFDYDQDVNLQNKIQRNRSFLESPIAENSFSSAGIPAPSAVSESLKVLPGQVVVPAVVDQVQGQALAALQVLKVPFCFHSCI